MSSCVAGKDNIIQQNDNSLLVNITRCDPKGLNKLTLQGDMASTRFYLTDESMAELCIIIIKYMSERNK